jgi:hypothetical protein
MIGTERFGCSKSFRIKVHKLKSNKSLMGTKDRWFLAGKCNLAGQPNTFVQPLLDATKIMEDNALALKNYLERQTMVEQEEFIFEVQDKWEELQAHKLENIQEGCGDNNQDDNNGNLFIMCEGTWFSQTPLKFFV